MAMLVFLSVFRLRIVVFKTYSDARSCILPACTCKLNTEHVVQYVTSANVRLQDVVVAVGLYFFQKVQSAT